MTVDAPAVLLARAHIIRADAAHAMGDEARAATLLDEVAVAPLDADDRSSLADELARADDLRRTMAGAQ